jgi:hypothetical protein
MTMRHALTAIVLGSAPRVLSEQEWGLYTSLILLAIGLGICLLVGLFKSSKLRPHRSHSGGPGDSLSRPIYWWTQNDCIDRRGLLRSLLALGGTGSGKTSGVLRSLMCSILADGMIGGVILASNFGEDREFYEKLFKQAGRLKDLKIVAPDQPLLFNWLEWERSQGADSKELGNLIMTAGESLTRGSGVRSRSEDSGFFRPASERMLEMSIEALRLTGRPLQACEIQRFINGAAKSAQQLGTDEWKKGFHPQILEAAHKAKKSEIEQSDCEQLLEYWLGELPFLNDRTRSSIEAQVNQVLHAFTGGIVNLLVGSKTTITPAVLDQGTWLLVDMPGTRFGASGQFVNAAWKLAIQRHLLRRHAKSGDRMALMVIDEFQNHCNSMDAKYLAECRSHLGGMLVLTQSLHAMVEAMGGDAGAETSAQSLCANFGHKVVCALSDDKSAEFGSNLIGRQKQFLYSGGQQPNVEMYDVLFDNQNQYSCNFAEHYELRVQHAELMHNLRTGGPPDYIVDAVVIRSGQAFSNGSNYMFCEFSQR